MIGVKGILKALKMTFSITLFSKSFADRSSGSLVAKKENYGDFADERGINDIVCVMYPPFVACFKRGKDGLYTAI